MELGIYIHGSSPFLPKETFEEYKELAIKYDELGFHSLWFADHLIRTPDPNKSSLFETWSLISALSVVTDKIKLGTMVTPVTFRNLGVFAKMISTIDHISNGRIIVGLGSGWYDKEHTMFGLELGTLARRFSLLENYIQGLLALWTSNEEVTLQKGEIHLNGAYINPKPIQKPHPPILIGGAGEKKTLKLVAKYAQMSNFGGSLSTIRHKLNVLEEHCKNEDRDYNDIITTVNRAVILGADEKEVEVGVKNYRQRFIEMGMSAPSSGDFNDLRLVGTPTQVITQINELENNGIKQINLTVNDYTTLNLLEVLIKDYMH
ncbi:MAG: LLM class flavin-dependent oxidoreductase [Candidatus Heimdallarchaeota archaeon]|nr:LLM class flavin-dependent oxidoreductase [Candidatus Heimdallarchaeota archaeon]MDH5645378.1 LLM class flavin-dependent oxidoreductase [Candidatus Heimdallarchaeota archaeon]